MNKNIPKYFTKAFKRFTGCEPTFKQYIESDSRLFENERIGVENRFMGMIFLGGFCLSILINILIICI